MNLKKNIAFLLVFTVKQVLFAQSDAFAGLWRMDYIPVGTSTPLYIDLQIAAVENNVLYPAQFTLQYGGFKGVYQLLLVKKSSRELAISKNKNAILTTPFNLFDATKYINGVLDLSRDSKGFPLLSLNRLVSKQNNFRLPDSLRLDDANRVVAEYLVGFLKDTELALSKISSIPWKVPGMESITKPSVSPVYFGLIDTISLSSRFGMARLTGAGNKKNDMVTVALNGHTILDKIYLEKKEYSEDIVLDTGLNMLVLFADNFGNDLPNKGKLNLEFGQKKIVLDFTNSGDSAATFIVVPLYCSGSANKDVWISDYTSTSNSPQLKPNEKMVGSLLSTTRQLTLALWDDAVEDGDSISIKINDGFITRGFPVLKQPQFIKVTLQPGANSISFIADNIGSIPPNTSVLEIIDGNKRRSFMLESVPGEKKILNIFYQLQGP